MAIDKSFFNYGTTPMDRFTVSLKATNGDGVSGINKIFMKVNKGPALGSCEIFPREGVAVITEFEFECIDWVDPEDIGIKHYSVASEY